jgi:hypothetical protein
MVFGGSFRTIIILIFTPSVLIKETKQIEDNFSNLQQVARLLVQEAEGFQTAL